MEDLEQEAIRLVLAGDREEYRVLMDRHFPTVVRMTLRITGNLPDAEEAAQEAFLQAYKQLATFRGQASFGTWVYRIAANCALNLVKRRSRKPEWNAERIEEGGQTMPTSHHPTPEAALLNEEARRQRERAMEILTPLERSAFVLRHLEEQPVEVVAKTLGVSTNNARQTVFRAVSKLRNHLRPANAARPAYPPSSQFKEAQ